MLELSPRKIKTLWARRSGVWFPESPQYELIPAYGYFGEEGVKLVLRIKGSGVGGQMRDRRRRSSGYDTDVTVDILGFVELLALQGGTL